MNQCTTRLRGDHGAGCCVSGHTLAAVGCLLFLCFVGFFGAVWASLIRGRLTLHYGFGTRCFFFWCLVSCDTVLHHQGSSHAERKKCLPLLVLSAKKKKKKENRRLWRPVFIQYLGETVRFAVLNNGTHGTRHDMSMSLFPVVGRQCAPAVGRGCATPPPPSWSPASAARPRP